MLIFAIDDEPRSLHLLHRAIVKVVPNAQVRDFSLGTAAIEAIVAQGQRPDIVFSDIQMPDLGGLELAVRLKKVSPASKIVFVTGYSQYALSAMYLHASGYILKPLQESRIREEIEHAAPAFKPAKDRLSIQCFGWFEVYWQGRPLMFGRQKTKELLAFLVDRQGVTCTAEEIANALWEDETDMRVLKHRVRNLVSDLKKTLADIGMEALIVRRSGQLAIQRDRVDCDYFRMLDGDMQATNAFQGEYMRQYSWPEITTGKLQFLKH